MPELPEVETIARTLEPQIRDLYIRRLFALRAKTLQWGAESLPLLEGALVRGVRRRAKILLVDLQAENGAPLLLAFHLKMTGELSVPGPGTEPGRHTRLVFELQDKSGRAAGLMFFNDMRAFGYCRVMRPEELESWSFWSKLGLEPLECPADDLARRFAGKRGKIKAVLLDQEVVCGIGNIYADEALFRAGIRPDAATDKLGSARLAKLAGEVQTVLREAITGGGSSIRDYRDAKGNAGTFQNTFKVYGRKGKPCPVCGRPLYGARVAGRGTTYCEVCQKG